MESSGSGGTPLLGRAGSAASEEPKGPGDLAAGMECSMANKTFWKGVWRLIEQPSELDAKGRLGAPCPPFVEGEDVKWVAEGAYGASGNFVPADAGRGGASDASPGRRQDLPGDHPGRSLVRGKVRRGEAGGAAGRARSGRAGGRWASRGRAPIRWCSWSGWWTRRGLAEARCDGASRRPPEPAPAGLTARAEQISTYLARSAHLPGVEPSALRISRGGHVPEREPGGTR